MIQLLRNYTLPEGELNPVYRSYEEYLTLASIPFCEGMSSRVVNALLVRMGNADLSIEQVSSDLALSKRTLQRRLQEQDTNFAQLRDDVRFNYAIKYLMNDGLSVDLVSKNLDFSDRTSFTNAFKRWTGLSPSVFRKLYRDDV